MSSEFDQISLRGKIALSVACLEELARAFDLDGERFEDLVELLWRPVVAPLAEWRTVEIPRTFGEAAALFERAPEEPALNQVRDALEHVWNVRECVLDPAPTTRARADDFLRSLLAIVEGAGGRRPDPAYFAERAPRGVQGFADVGRAAPPAYYREAFEWDEVEPAMRRGLCSVSVHRRREAAFALRFLGLPSRAIERVLVRTVGDRDPEVREQSRLAWWKLFTNPLDSEFGVVYYPHVPDFRGYIHRRLSRWSRSLEAPPLLADLEHDQHSEDRRKTVERAGRFVSTNEALAAKLDSIHRHDPIPVVRYTAAIWISEAPFSEERLSSLVDSLRVETDLLARAAKLFAIGACGPRAVPAIHAILASLDHVEHPMYDASAFYAAEALDAIGSAGFDTIVRTVTSGNQSRAERWLRSLALRPDLRDALVEEIERRTSGEEPWIEARYQRALGILRSRTPVEER